MDGTVALMQLERRSLGRCSLWCVLKLIDVGLQFTLHVGIGNTRPARIQASKRTGIAVAITGAQGISTRAVVSNVSSSLFPPFEARQQVFQATSWRV